MHSVSLSEYCYSSYSTSDSYSNLTSYKILDVTWRNVTNVHIFVIIVITFWLLWKHLRGLVMMKYSKTLQPLYHSRNVARFSLLYRYYFDISAHRFASDMPHSCRQTNPISVVFLRRKKEPLPCGTHTRENVSLITTGRVDGVIQNSWVLENGDKSTNYSRVRYLHLQANKLGKV